LILPSCLSKAAFNVCFMARLMEVCLRSENWRFPSAPVIVPQRLRHPLAHLEENVRLTHQPYSLQWPSLKR